AGTGLIGLACLVAGELLLAVLVPLLGATVAAQVGVPQPLALRFAGLLLAAALALTLGVELFYIADFQQATEWYRMNTVFKFYMQAWVLFGCGGAVALSLLFRRWRHSGPLSLGGRVLWLAALLVLAGPAAAFALGGPQSRLAEQFPVRPPGPTLDGMAFMHDNQFTWGPITNTVTVNLADDRAAYSWLISHGHGWPVIATAPTAPDPEGMFVATYTGFPVVVGSMHQEEQRDPAVVTARRLDMAELYRTADQARAAALLYQYGVRYVYVGPYERWIAADAPAGLAKFPALEGTVLDRVYANASVTIYQVRDAAR
ncbi:MAG TPA: DUF2298 domain-containing protein, partial [Chloroflexia bacterium]|nr:DUF2298 domain-containing protein [Chloroflexia bacterium]